MTRHPLNKHVSAGNPIANVIVVLVGALAIGAFIVLGVFAAVALGGILLVLAAVLGIRMWWLGRKLPRHRRTASSGGQSGPGDSTVIEGDFEVVSSDQDRKDSDEKIVKTPKNS